MEMRERHHDPRLRQRLDPGGPNPPPADLSAVRERGRRLVAARRDVVSRFLSGDSEAFLAAYQQQGGQ